ncbi:hypothetical protein LJC33_09130 [Eubacteriales bacterium OttesenSCG-928-N13]|nr:hypothetical protein [Eubacteriales bacterium OttesenSCG-928-N13]
MTTVNSAKEFFEKCRRLERRVDDKLDEAVRLRALATNITANYSDQPHGGGSINSPIERAVLRLIELEREIADAVNDMVDHRRAAQSIIDSLTDDRYRDVLTWRYFSLWNWEQIAEAMACERMQVWRLHGRALLAASELLAKAPMNC